MRVEISIAFRRIICRRCGEKRIVGVACPTCGEAPDEREVDPDRQRRVRIARAALGSLDDSLPEPRPAVSPQEMWSRLSDFTNGFLDALGAAVANESREHELVEAIAGFQQLRADVAGAIRLRPWIDAWRAVEDVVSRLGSVIRHYLSAIAADTPIEAQHEARRAQNELDAAADPAAALSVRMNAWGRAEAAPTMEEAIALLTENAFERSAARNLIEFDKAGYAIYERITGDKRPLHGLGVGLNIIAEQASGPYEEARVWSVAQQSFELLAGDQTWLSGLVGDPTWRADLKSALEKLWDAGRLQAAAATAVRHERQAVRLLVDFGQDLVESTGKRYVASLVAARKKRDYGSYRAQSAGALLQAASQIGLGDLVSGLDRAVRIASAHDEFDLDNNEVVLMDRGVGVERIALDVLVDRVLEGTETTLALSLGVYCAAIYAGLPLEEALPALDTLGISPEEAFAWVLSSAGWRDVEVGVEEKILYVSGAAEKDSFTLKHVATLFAYGAGDYEEVSVRALSSDGAHELRGPSEPFRAFRDANHDAEKQRRHIELLRQWRRDGNPLVEEKQARKVLAALALQTLASLEVSQAIRQMRLFRGTAQRIGDSELSDLFSRLIGSLRDTWGGLLPDAYAAAVNELTKLAAMRVPPIQDL